MTVTFEDLLFAVVIEWCSYQYLTSLKYRMND